AKSEKERRAGKVRPGSPARNETRRGRDDVPYVGRAVLVHPTDRPKMARHTCLMRVMPQALVTSQPAATSLRGIALPLELIDEDGACERPPVDRAACLARAHACVHARESVRQDGPAHPLELVEICGA